ncbi:MAG: exodeoxyribonuclease V subunit gamma, partial [Gammaproteobacteria bacterium]
HLEPRDVVVMAPAIEEYAAAIEAVFGEVSDERRIPWSIADRAPIAGNAAARAFLHLLGLPESRFGANELLGLVSVPVIARKFGIDPEELEGLRERVLASGVRLGLDESGSVGAGPSLERNTWRFGLRRLLLGVALEDTEPFAGILPIASPGGDDAERIGELADFVERLAEQAVSLRADRSIDEWRDALLALLRTFFPEASTDAPEVAVLQRVIDESVEAMTEARPGDTLPREMIVELLTARLNRVDGGHGFLGGGVNFCQLTPLRSIPFRVVCLLGMNATDFPREQETPDFDLMARARCAGDPSRRDDDRYLFLESLVAARDCLYLSRVAKDQRNDEAQEPALPLAELRDCVDLRCGEGTSERLTRKHPLMPFDPLAFDPANPQRSFRQEW